LDTVINTINYNGLASLIRACHKAGVTEMELHGVAKFRIGEAPLERPPIPSDLCVERKPQQPSMFSELDNEVPNAIIDEEGTVESFQNVAEDLESELDTAMITDSESYEEYVIQELSK